MSDRVYHLIRHAVGIKGMAKSILIHLAMYGEDDGTSIYPSLVRLSKESGFDLKTVKRAIASLVADELVKVEKQGTWGRGNTAEYRIDLEVLRAMSDPEKGAERPGFEDDKGGRSAPVSMSIKGGGAPSIAEEKGAERPGKGGGAPHNPLVDPLISSSRAREVPPAEWMSLGRQIAEAMGIDPVRNATLNYSLVAGWLNSGCDAEADIMSTVRRITATKRDIRSLGYFTTAIIEARQTRLGLTAPTTRPENECPPGLEYRMDAVIRRLENSGLRFKDLPPGTKPWTVTDAQLADLCGEPLRATG